MSVLVLFRWHGDPHHLLATYDRELQHPVAREQPRRVSHMCAATDDGMVIVDVWESEEDFRAMKADAEFQQNLRDSGTPEPDTLDVWPVHASVPYSAEAADPIALATSLPFNQPGIRLSRDADEPCGPAYGLTEPTRIAVRSTCGSCAPT
jgi:hypothetical protein